MRIPFFVDSRAGERGSSVHTLLQLSWFFRKYWKRYAVGIFFLFVIDLLML
jgi:hypothetical protein